MQLLCVRKVESTGATWVGAMTDTRYIPNTIAAILLMVMPVFSLASTTRETTEALAADEPIRGIWLTNVAADDLDCMNIVCVAIT